GQQVEVEGVLGFGQVVRSQQLSTDALHEVAPARITAFAAVLRRHLRCRLQADGDLLTWAHVDVLNFVRNGVKRSLGVVRDHGDEGNDACNENSAERQ